MIYPERTGGCVPLVEKKTKPDKRETKKSFAFYLSHGLVEDIEKISKETGRSKSDVLEILARAGVELHKKNTKR